MKTFIFDFDGTIVNNLPQVMVLLQKELLTKGIDLSKYSTDTLRNIGVKSFMNNVHISKLELLSIYQNIKRDIRSHLEDYPPVKGLAEVLSSLSENHRLFIFSSNKKESIQSYLSRYKLDILFENIFEDSSYFGKHIGLKKIIKDLSLKLGDIYYLGDESRDILAAQKAGVSSVAVTWGFEGEGPLSLAAPDYIMSSPKELLELSNKL